MDGAALLLLVAGVGFGWQPMPDGSPRYEYIVQVDSDLAAALADGQSIPIVGEVPEEIHPIGRVRVVIGEGAPPRERLVTRLKPAIEETVVRGQNAVGQPPYNQYQYAQPPATQPLASAPTTWNGGEATPASTPAPSGQALFDSAAQAWNQSVAAPATNALNNAGQNLGAAVAAPMQAGVDNVANQMQQAYGSVSQQAQAAASSLGDRTKGILDEVTRPLTQQPAQTARDVRQQQPQQQPAAPTTSGSFAGAAAPPVQNWNQETPPATDPLRSGVAAPQPQPTAVQTWNDAPTGNAAPPPPSSSPQFYAPPQNNGVAATQPPPGQFQPPPTQQAPAPGESAWNTVETPGGFGAPQPNNGVAPPAQSAPSPDDLWKYAADPRTGLPAGSAADVAAGASSTAPFRGAGTNSPPIVGDPTTAPVGSPGVGAALPDDGRPKINSGLLAELPDRPLDLATPGAASLSAPGLSAVGVSTSAAQLPPVVRPDIFSGGQAANAASPPLAGLGQPPAGATPAGTSTSAAASAGDRDNGFIALVAWVMLFGSVFGNLYLFWSYLDVRQKYRSLVRKTARAVGSRFSAA